MEQLTINEEHTFLQLMEDGTSDNFFQLYQDLKDTMTDEQIIAMIPSMKLIKFMRAQAKLALSVEEIAQKEPPTWLKHVDSFSKTIFIEPSKMRLNVLEKVAVENFLKTINYLKAKSDSTYTYLPKIVYLEDVDKFYHVLDDNNKAVADFIEKKLFLGPHTFPEGDEMHEITMKVLEECAKI